jgi:hypothetical protein
MARNNGVMIGYGAAGSGRSGAIGNSAIAISDAST